MTSDALDRRAERSSDRTFFVFNAVLSAAALAFLAYVLMIRGGGAQSVSLRFLPAVNAALNATAGVLLCAGWVAIKRGARRVHQYLMVSAFAASSLFLLCYLAYHWVHGDTKFTGQGAIRPVYFAILISHIVLSAAIVPMSLSSFYFAWRKKLASHRKVGKVLMPIWIYVSITGVAIYFFLRDALPARP